MVADEDLFAFFNEWKIVSEIVTEFEIFSFHIVSLCWSGIQKLLPELSL